MAARREQASTPADERDESAVGAEPVAETRVENDIEQGIEHLQTAAHEMLAAARAFLDVVEDVVSDRDKLGGVASSLTDLFSSAGASLSRLADRASTSSTGRDEQATPPRIRRIDVE